MAFLRRPKPSAKSAQEASQTRVASRLLATALDGFQDRQERLTILDLGSGAAGTVEFFAELDFPTHLIFGDCLTLVQELPQPSVEEEGPTFEQSVTTFARHLGIDPSAQIDLVLLWDFLHYFDLRGVEVLSSVLQPHIFHATRGYGFGTLHNHQGIKPYHYSIAGESDVYMQPTDTSALPFSHSQQVLTEHFNCMRITRGTLLKEGHLELLLEP